MADAMTDIWTLDGGCFTVLADIDRLQDELTSLGPHEWLRAPRVTWQDPERGEVNEAYPLVEETVVAVRVGSVTALTRSGPSAAASLHRARAEPLR